MILQNTNSRFNLFRIESFDSRVCYLGEPWRKICWLSQQGTEKRIFRLIFRIGFDIITTVVLQNTISRFNFFQIASLIADCVSLVSHEKKSVDCRSKEQRRAFSELSFEMGLLLFKVLQFWSDCTGPVIVGGLLDQSRSWSFHSIYLFKFSVCALNFMCA